MSTKQTPTPFTHVPRLAIIGEGYTEQRYFGTLADAVRGTRGAGEQYAAADVFRLESDDVARLGVQVGCGVQSQASLSIHLDANSLRDLARRLIDAAHDIENNPAYALRRAA